MRPLPRTLSLFAALLLCACSRQPQPMVDAVKPMQQSIESAKGVEQTLQQAADAQQKKAQEP